ncbi:hypothetical protein [Microbacterium foliorum]|uniref:hypothetical protein n=1 Tax=Microbacterium foliorum TaxID=104336 RepID=UPI0028D1F6B9|nr:hypothetical protein [Microbacterium foliorum]
MIAVAETAPAADPTAPVKAGVAEIPELGDLAAPVSASALRNPHEINERAGGALLGCPAPTPPSFVPEFSFSESTNPVVLATGGFREVVSTPQQRAEAAAFFEDAKAAESAGARQRANRLHGPVFSLMQYRRNARTGQTMLTQEQIDAGLNRLREMEVLEHHAEIWQDRDTYNAQGAADRTAKGWGQVDPGDFVPLHWHAVIKLNPGNDLTVRQVSDIFKIPASRVRIPSETLDDSPKGRGAAMAAFVSLCRYLTHEEYAS